MAMNMYYLLILWILCMLLNFKKIESKRTYTPTIPDSSSLQTSSSESSEELPSPPEFDSSRTVTTTELPCGPSCAKAGRHKIKQNSPRKKPDPIGYKEPKPIPRNKNNTSSEFPKRKRSKYSRQYDPTGKTDNGFVPIPGPYAGKTTPRNAQRRARIRNQDELVVKESRQSPNILGNGNFEILGGGIFSDDETNEIGEGRRVGRVYEPYGLTQFQQIPFNAQNFQFPSFYQRQPQVPTHPLFFQEQLSELN